MFHLTLPLRDSAPLTLVVPADWSEVTTRQAIALLTVPDEQWTNAWLFNVLSGVDVADLRSTQVPTLPDWVYHDLAFLSNEPDFTAMACPVSINVGGKIIHSPADVTLETYGQRIDLDESLKKLSDGQNVGQYVSLAKALLSIHMCSAITGQEYTDIAQALSIWPQLEQLPAVQLLPRAASYLA